MGVRSNFLMIAHLFYNSFSFTPHPQILVQFMIYSKASQTREDSDETAALLNNWVFILTGLLRPWDVQKAQLPFQHTWAQRTDKHETFCGILCFWICTVPFCMRFQMVQYAHQEKSQVSHGHWSVNHIFCGFVFGINCLHVFFFNIKMFIFVHLFYLLKDVFCFF